MPISAIAGLSIASAGSFPTFRQFRHQTIGIRVDVEQAIVDLGGEGVDNQEENMRLKLSSLLAAASMLCGQAFAAPAPALPANA
jgi:hypothetical protein